MDCIKYYRLTLLFTGMLLISMLMTGCQPARMLVPPDLQQNSYFYECEGRQGFKFNEDFIFGPYAVTNVRRGWTRTDSWIVGKFETRHARQNYEYRVTGPGPDVWYGQAATGVSRSDIRQAALGGEFLWGLTYDLNFVVRIGTETPGRVWTLIMSQEASDRVFTGVLTDEITTYRVEGIDSLEGSSMPLGEAAGYLFTLDGIHVAAVEVINKGSVRLSVLLDDFESDLLATAATALLLYQDISQN